MGGRQNEEPADVVEAELEIVGGGGTDDELEIDWSQAISDIAIATSRTFRRWPMCTVSCPAAAVTRQ